MAFEVRHLETLIYTSSLGKVLANKGIWYIVNVDFPTLWNDFIAQKKEVYEEVKPFSKFPPSVGPFID